jgi:hypothetical protein
MKQSVTWFVCGRKRLMKEAIWYNAQKTVGDDRENDIVCISLLIFIVTKGPHLHGQRVTESFRTAKLTTLPKHVQLDSHEWWPLHVWRRTRHWLYWTVFIATIINDDWSLDLTPYKLVTQSTEPRVWMSRIFERLRLHFENGRCCQKSTYWIWITRPTHPQQWGKYLFWNKVAWSLYCRSRKHWLQNVTDHGGLDVIYIIRIKYWKKAVPFGRGDRGRWLVGRGVMRHEF